MTKPTTICPSCGKPADKLIKGVCVHCKTSFQTAHKGKLDAKWEPGDFSYHAAKQAAPQMPIIMDDEDAEKHDRMAVKAEAKDFFKRGARLLVQYKGNKTLALYAYCFAHEWYDLIECETAAEIAVKLFKNPKKKAAVTKAILLFQDALGIEPGRGQRSGKGRNQMAKARKNQLKPK